jgi:hypothetical protein
LSSDKGAEGKGWHNREIKPKEFKDEEGHIALGVEGHLALGEVAYRIACNHIWVKPCFLILLPLYPACKGI